MARPFKYPEVAALEPGQFAQLEVPETFGAFMRRCRKYADRNNKEFSFIDLLDGRYQVTRQDGFAIAVTAPEGES